MGRHMGTVRVIGEGYYGIVTEGVSVDADATNRIDRAFEEARTVSSETLVIRSPGAPSASTSIGIVKTGTRGAAKKTGS